MRILISVSGKEEPGLFPMENSIPVRRKGRCTPGYGNFGLSWSQSCYSGRSPSACRNRQITRSDRHIRKTIQKQGGEIRFGCRVTGLIIRENSIQGVIAGGQEIASRHVILATGHSARDIYRMLQRQRYGWSRRFCRRIAFRASPAGDRSHPIPHPGRERQMVTAAEYNFVTNITDGEYILFVCVRVG